MRPRTCTSCRQTFLSAEGIRTHKVLGGCRTPEALIAGGWTLTARGWQHAHRNAEYARKARTR